MDVMKLSQYQALSPFEIKDFLIKAALAKSEETAASFINAGRGNPNWIATVPRDAFFLLGQFALTESRRVLDLPPAIGGMPKAKGIGQRLRAWLEEHRDMPGATFLKHMLPWVAESFGFVEDDFVHELVDSIIGDNYPVPDRMLKHAELVVREYVQWAMCGDPRPQGTFKLYAVEGGTAAMCYIFKSLKANRLLNPGDRIALAVPIFTPYLEMPILEDYDLKITEIHCLQEDRFQIGDDLEKLLDPEIKAFFVVNPGNPSAMALSRETIDRIGAILEKRPDLIILTDDVYGTFVPGFRSLMGAFPHNTIGVYSYSKYFGCTGWRLGLIALHEDNVLDRLIARHSDDVRAKIHKRYHALTLDPHSLAFIDRIVADSRDVALNHTAGLSLPQQLQMALFSLFALLDEGDTYRTRRRSICQDRLKALARGLGLDLHDDPLRTGYYATLDVEAWALKNVGPDFMAYVNTHREPLDLVFTLATRHQTVLLNGSGFHGPPWSARVSLANLDDAAYAQIGKNLAAVVKGAVEKWEKAGRPVE